MVHISRIVLRNFKSFNGTIKLKFDKGFNVITGPNGSGKSNILDAVQFVLGELGSKRMRVPDLSGLIYDAAGTDGSKPQYSQVTIYFDNNDRGLAIDRNSISIGRRMDRAGKSKYFLNGKRTSRKQLLDLLTMAGITPGGYNIVLQGTATRLSDLNPSERMNALEDLVGLTEYDEKKSEAKVRLNEAERKIEIASAKSDEVRKRVNELERQMNDALRFNLLSRDEARLQAITLSTQITSLEQKIQGHRETLKQNKESIETLEKDREELTKERDEARERLEEFTKEASERGNTQLPILKSELVGKRTLIRSIESRLREIETLKNRLNRNIESKHNEIERSKTEIDEKKKNLEEYKQREIDLNKQIEEKTRIQTELFEKIRTQKETAESNQVRVEQLTADLVPMQESLSGLEISINRHTLNSNSIQGKIEDLEQKRADSQKTIETLKGKIKDFETLKVDEAAKFEDMLNSIESQVQRQKNIRSTIEGANQLAKDAELSITQFTAKRDLWKNIVTDQKAQARIAEMAESGALQGYHGTLRSLVKIDLKYQRAADTASSGWSHAIVVQDIKTAVECIESLKRNRLGMTRFIPLNDINPPNSLPDVDMSGVEGYLPSLIRYDQEFDPAVKLIWGDTYVVKDKETAERMMNSGYRAVTLEGDLFEIDGGLIGGHWRRAPDYSKLVPSEESIKDLSGTIKSLRKRLSTRMSDLRKSGNSLRDFTGMLDHFNSNIDGINKQISETKESIQRIQRNIGTINNNIKKISTDKKNELNLASTLQERKEKTLNEIERTKKEIAELRGLTPSDIRRFEVDQDNIQREIGKLRGLLSQIRSDISVQTSLVERYLSMKTEDIEAQISNWNQQIASFDEEKADNDKRLNEEQRLLK
ncbi:MAG: AAA family ATPase, partial [Candidatus Thorarchaeota archaeon]